jgi:hypothetical protein
MSAKKIKADAKKKADSGDSRRPDVNQAVPDALIEKMERLFAEIREILEEHAAHLKALDRKRLLGVGIKTQGFIKRIQAIAKFNPQFIPYYLSPEKLREDYDYYTKFLSLYEGSKQINELLWNITILSGHVTKTDSLGYYATLREAAKRGIDPAETLYKEMEVFYKKTGRAEDKPTVKKVLSHADALMHGKRDGEIVIKNVSPKVTGGAHEIIDVIGNRD